ncbi:hypothetical protein HanXRQr2_Chr03g0114541 [Helianthus annuus]|uniref:Uncharacterized protein n=1 Tax=Helianthus annuus TaxID=4232 RepID=A0A9K3JGH9_HELAN|nr:hypothetical protein HanXRQr2_Chr03g0114541 [Helianthus annuus]KAJ0601167.1 hypothetical protein HanIR_Chr03g0125301 [Helianthus annuus]KAJ0943977.1 hypothetical protein HanPSC8_Chr03g0110911 [Helianthus annuus]
MKGSIMVLTMPLIDNEESEDGHGALNRDDEITGSCHLDENRLGWKSNSV